MVMQNSIQGEKADRSRSRGIAKGMLGLLSPMDGGFTIGDTSICRGRLCHSIMAMMQPTCCTTSADGHVDCAT
nr:hypothetical protein BOH68_11150 [Cobetia sp. MM1IDA2H-1]